MAEGWKTVRVFISSTFRDMHSERDHLVRFVFPELRERCAKRRLQLIDVDLRWGVTEEEAEQGKVLELCLDEIERCRPFFIGLLGERYGWVPSRYDVPDEQRYDWVRDFEPGQSITAMEIYHGVLRDPAMTARAFFYFRDPAFLSSMPEQHRVANEAESEEAAAKLRQLKTDLRTRCRVFENYPCSYSGLNNEGGVLLTGLDPFGQRVLEDLWSAISEEHPQSETPPGELAVERAYHEAFIESRSQRFIGRQELLARLTEYVDGDENSLLVITGAPGCGKSALLANFAGGYAAAHADVLVLPHFIGAIPGSTDIRQSLERLCGEMGRHCQTTPAVPGEFEELYGEFWRLLDLAAASGKVVLVLDGLDQLDDSHRARSLEWLPQSMSRRLRLIVSTLEGDCLEALRRRGPGTRELTVTPLEIEERKEIVRQTLGTHRKRLDEQQSNDQMALLLKKTDSDNPLFLIAACEELRVFGEFDRVTGRIADLPDDVTGLFAQVLERLEHDHGREIVEKALTLLECSRGGLLENEMLELLAQPGSLQVPRAIWARLYRSLQFYLTPPGEAAEALLDFFHRQLASAVKRRYLMSEENEIAMHRRLAEYFRRKAGPTAEGEWTAQDGRALIELPYHQTKARSWEQLADTLSDGNFFRAAIGLGHGRRIVDEYVRSARAMQELAAASAPAHCTAVTFAARYAISIPLQADAQRGRFLEDAASDAESSITLSTEAVDAAIAAAASALALGAISSPRAGDFLALGLKRYPESYLVEDDHASAVAAVAIAAEFMQRTELRSLASDAVGNLSFINHTWTRWREAARVAAILSMGGANTVDVSDEALAAISQPIGDLEIEQNFSVAFRRYGPEGSLRFVTEEQNKARAQGRETLADLRAKIDSFPERARPVAKAISLARELSDETLVASLIDLVRRVCEKLGPDGQTLLEWVQSASSDSEAGLDAVSRRGIAKPREGSITGRFNELRSVNLAEWPSGTSQRDQTNSIIEFIALVAATREVDPRAAEEGCNWFRAVYRPHLDEASVLRKLEPLPDSLDDFSRAAANLFAESREDPNLETMRHESQAAMLRGMLAFGRALTGGDLSGALRMARGFTTLRQRVLHILACGIARRPRAERHVLYGQAMRYVLDSHIHEAEDLFGLMLLAEEKCSAEDLPSTLSAFVARLDGLRGQTLN